MLMGHSYLIAPAMSLTPLLRLLAALLVAAAAAHGGGRAWACGPGPPGIRWLTWKMKPCLWLPVRWGVGFVGPLVLGWMAWQTARIRSTQSATGILYVVVIFCFLGELTSQLLLRQHRRHPVTRRLRSVNIRFACPACDYPGRLDVPRPRRLAVPALRPPAAACRPTEARTALACAVCGNARAVQEEGLPALARHDHPRRWPAWPRRSPTGCYDQWLTWAILIGSAAFDGLLYLLVRDVVVCYRCDAHYRGVPRRPGAQAVRADRRTSATGRSGCAAKQLQEASQ